MESLKNARLVFLDSGITKQVKGAVDGRSAKGSAADGFRVVLLNGNLTL